MVDVQKIAEEIAKSPKAIRKLKETVLSQTRYAGECRSMLRDAEMQLQITKAFYDLVLEKKTKKAL